MTHAIEPVDRAASPEVMALIGRVFDEYGFDWTEEEEFWDFLGEEYPYDPPRGQMWVMRDASGAVVGSVAVELLDSEVAEFHRLYLEQLLRGTGQGRRLLETAEQWAVERGCRRGVLWSDTSFHEAHRLYERLGYKRTGRRELHDTAESMEWRYERDLESGGPAG